MANSRRLQIWIPAELADRAELAAKLAGVPLVDWVRQAVIERLGGLGASPRGDDLETSRDTLLR